MKWASVCPTCGKWHDAVTAVLAPRAPLPGDLSLCHHCGEVSEYTQGDERLDLRPIDVAALPVGLRLVVHAARELIAHRLGAPRA